MNNISPLEAALKKNEKQRTLIEDENGNLIEKGTLTRWDRYRIFLKRWWIFVLSILAICVLIQTAVSILEYLN